MKKTIQQVVLTNYKKHKELALDIKGHSFILSGGNGAGKTSVLQAIDHMVSGSQLADDSITIGEESGGIELMMAANGDTYRVSRRFTKKGLGRYELRKDAGNGRFDQLTPAVERFREIFGNVLDLSPLIDMDGQSQLSFILEVMDLDGGAREYIKKIESEVEALQEDRLLCGRMLRDLKAQEASPTFRSLVNYVGEQLVDIDEISKKLVDVSDLSSKIAAAEMTNRYAEQQISTLNGIKVADEEIISAIKNVVDMIAAKKVDVFMLKSQLDKAKEINEKVGAEIADAKEKNRLIELSKQYSAVVAEISEKDAQYKGYTASISAKLGSLSDSLTKIGVGQAVDGLSIVYEVNPETNKPVRQGLYYNGMPFNRSQQSYGEMVMVLVKLTKALNYSGLGYVKISDWNLLDSHNQDAIILFAKENDLQLGIERVDESDEIELQLIEK